MPTVFFIGATAYIGSSALVTLRSAFPTYKIKALTRNVDAVDVLNKQPPVGLPAESPAFSDLDEIEAVKGTFSDLDLISKLASEADVVINAADSDNLTLTQALLEGMKVHFEAGKGAPIFIHTSGGAVYWDKAEGSFDPESRVWTDNDDDVRELSKTMADRLHGPVDLAILQAHEAGYVNAAIILPTLVHGIGRSPLPMRGFESIVADARSRGTAGYVGEGTNHFGAVHVNDLTDLYVLVFRHLTSSEVDGALLTPSAYSRYIIASPEVGAPFKDFAKMLGAAMHALGELDDAAPVSYTPDEAKKSPFLAFFGQRNMLIKPERAYKLGWVPKLPALADTIQADIEALLKASRAQ